MRLCIQDNKNLNWFKWLKTNINFHFIYVYNIVGYNVVAIEQIFDSRSDKNNKFNGPDVVPAPENLEFLKQFESQLKILSRVTIIVSDVNVLHRIVSIFNNKYYCILRNYNNNIDYRIIR